MSDYVGVSVSVSDWTSIAEAVGENLAKGFAMGLVGAFYDAAPIVDVFRNTTVITSKHGLRVVHTCELVSRPVRLVMGS